MLFMEWLSAQFERDLMHALMKNFNADRAQVERCMWDQSLLVILWLPLETVTLRVSYTSRNTRSLLDELDKQIAASAPMQRLLDHRHIEIHELQLVA